MEKYCVIDTVKRVAISDKLKRDHVCSAIHIQYDQNHLWKKNNLKTIIYRNVK